MVARVALPASKLFPASVREAMTASGAAATCIAVELDGGGPEAAFLHRPCRTREQGGSQGRPQVARAPLARTRQRRHRDRPRRGGGAASGGAYRAVRYPFVCEILVTPGKGGAHFEVLDLLSRQPRLTWFFGDRGFEIIRTQQHPLENEQRAQFAALLKGAPASRRHDPNDPALRQPCRARGGGKSLHAAQPRRERSPPAPASRSTDIDVRSVRREPSSVPGSGRPAAGRYTRASRRPSPTGRRRGTDQLAGFVSSASRSRSNTCGSSIPSSRSAAASSRRYSMLAPLGPAERRICSTISASGAGPR